MNTWSATLTVSDDKLQQVHDLLETISQEPAVFIINYLAKADPATFSELLINCGLELSALETGLAQLGRARVIIQKPEVFENYYSLNRGLLHQINILSRGLSGR